MRKINPNLLKLAEMTHNPSLAELNLEERVEEIIYDSEVKNIPGYIYVPSINLYVAERRSLLGKNWYQCHKELHERGKRMLTLHEFVELLKYLKGNPDEKYRKISDEIFDVRDLLSAEWIDADFKVINNKLHMLHRHETINGELIPKYSIEIKDYLADDRVPGIDMDDWINSPTDVGLPRIKIKKGNLFYRAPLDDNNSVVRVGADFASIFLNCIGDPTCHHNCLGIHAAYESTPMTSKKLK